MQKETTHDYRRRRRRVLHRYWLFRLGGRMNAGIVERLRVWSDNAKEQDATEIVAGLCQAADEIERLRNDLDGTRLAYRGASYDRDRMRTERDEARRELCIALGKDHVAFTALTGEYNHHNAARDRGWDCFKEEP